MARTKAPAASGGSFPFVISHGPKPPEDPAIRTMIRRQAMKDVGLARRRRGTYGRANTGQSVCFDNTNSPKRAAEAASADANSNASTSTSPSTGVETLDESSGGATSVTDYDEIPSNDVVVRSTPSATVHARCSILSPLSLMSGYERMRFEYGLDLSMLTVLTNFNVGKSAITTLASDPARLPSLLVSEPQYSYLSFVPSRYERSAVLASATDCVIAKVRAALSPGFEHDAIARRLYGKALRTLQEAINDPCSRGDANVLCAIQMLSIHELLDPSRENAWSNHISGSGQLVKSRTPASFSSEYDKSLFVGNVGPALSEALFNNHSCFLEAPEWNSLYMSTAQETEYLTERSELVLNARKHMFPLPRLWRDVGAALTSDDLFNDDLLRGVEKRCRSIHADLLAWLEEYKCHCVARSLAQPTRLEIDLRRETFGAVLECLLIAKRLITSLSDSDRLKVECETQAIAKLIMDLQDQPMPKHSWLFAAHEIGVAQVCFATKEIFEQDSSDETCENQKLAMRNRYMAFSGTLRGT